MIAACGEKRKREDGGRGRDLGICDEHGMWFSIPGYSSEKIRCSDDGFLKIWRPNGGWGKPTLGSLCETGYRRVNIDGKVKYAHDLLCTAFFGIKPDPTYTAQHGLGGRGDNSRDNLKGWASKKEQVTEYRKEQKPHRDGKPILVWKVDQSEDDAVEYESVHAAKKATGATALNQVANGIQHQSGGFVAKWAPARETQDDLPGEGYSPAHHLAEEWRAVTPNLWVSSRGRAWQQSKTGVVWMHKFTPVGTEGHPYARIVVNGKQKKFHVVAFDAFFPGVRGKREIDHINRKKANNNLNNLKPATRAENAANVTRKDRTEINNSVKKATRGRPVGTTEWVIEAPSVREAAEALAIRLDVKTNMGNLSAAVREGKPYFGWEFQIRQNL